MISHRKTTKVASYGIDTDCSPHLTRFRDNYRDVEVDEVMKEKIVQSRVKREMRSEKMVVTRRNWKSLPSSDTLAAKPA